MSSARHDDVRPGSFSTMSYLREESPSNPAPTIEKKLAIAFRAEDGALNDAADRPSRLRRDPGCGAIAHFALYISVPHDPAFSDMLTAGFELRLDERDQLGLWDGECKGRRQYRGKADKARITCDGVDWLGDFLVGQIACVQPLVNNDPRIHAQLPGELAVADIDGMDALGAPRQQHIGKAAG